MTELSNNFDLSAEQQDTAALLNRLLGRAIADRYSDFCRLAAGAFELRVSSPLAAHALRELDSILRRTLETPMDAKASCTPEDMKKLELAQEQLCEIGFDEAAIREALKKLKPQLNHKQQVKKIVKRLGLDPGGDIAKAWISLCDAFGKAHKRSFHHSLTVNDEFRTNWQQPFDLVIRAIAIALQDSYSTLMQRVEEIAAMPDAGHGVSLFEQEIPGALPLQWHFFEHLETADWLPHLMKRNLIGKPFSSLGQTNGNSIRFREWPAGHYILRMAQSPEPATRKLVAEVISKVASSNHPDVRREGIEIIAALPVEESASLADVAAAWLDRNEQTFFLRAPERLVKHLANGGQKKAALHVARSLLRIFGRNGEIASLYDRHMYEYNLPGLMNVLTEACDTDAFKLFCDILQQAAIISGKFCQTPPADYSHLTSRPITDDEVANYDIYDALIVTVRQSAEKLVQADAGHMAVIMTLLNNYPPKIFKRIALSVLAKKPGSIPNLSDAYLTDAELIEADWCQHEYAELAIAWFPSMGPEKQNEVLKLIDSVPNKYRESWKIRFEERNKRPPAIEDNRIFDAAVIQGLLWKWRAVLPAERQQALNKIVDEIGDPDEWRHNLFPREESPLTGQDFSARPVVEIVNFLQSWRPKEKPHQQTVTALAQELRQAVQQDPVKYAETADQFLDLASIYIRRLLEGLQNAVRKDFPWSKVLELIDTIFSRMHDKIDPSSVADGDDPNWLWACTAADELLKDGLRQGAGGISYHHAEHVQLLVLKLLQHAPKQPEVENFEERFQREPYFAAEATLRGSAVELCILLIFWLSKHDASPVAKKPREALISLPDICNVLEVQLADCSSAGRIPRAILGRYLNWLFYFGEDWLKSQMATLFHGSDESLRRAAWLGHLRNDQGPVKQLIPHMQVIYTEEIANLADNIPEDVQNRLGEYLLVLYLVGALPDDLLEAFWQTASSRLRQHVMWFLGRELALPEDQLPADYRTRGLSYWESRLKTARESSDPDTFREELGVIGQWCNWGQIETSWLLDQLLLMLQADFAPKDAYSVVEWLAKILPQNIERAMEVLHALLTSPHAERWAYMTNKESIRIIMTEGCTKGTAKTSVLVEKLVSFLASRGETDYLDIIR